MTLNLDIRTKEFQRHRGPVTGVALIPGTNSVVTSAYDAAVGLFNLDSGEVRLLGYHRHLVNRIVVDRQFPRAASCSSDYTIGLWDLATLRPLRTLLGHYDDVEDFVFIDKTTGASASRDRRVLIWDLSTGAILHVLEGHEKDVLALAYHDGRLYSSGDDMTLRMWDVRTGAPLKMWGPFENETDTCALDPARHRAVLGCDDGFLRIFNTETGVLEADLEAHRSGVKKVAVSPLTGDILSAAYDQKIIIWDAESLQAAFTVQSPHSIWERSLTWSPDGVRILGGTFDGTVVTFDAQGRLVSEIGDTAPEPGNACLNDIATVGDGVIAVVSDDGFIRLGHLTTSASSWLARMEPPGGRILMNAVAMSSDGTRLAAGSHDNKLHIYSVDGTAGIHHDLSLNLHEGPINSLQFCESPGYEGNVFVACYSGVIARVGADGVVRERICLHEGAVKSLRLHPSKPLGVSCGADGLLLAWDLDGRLLQRFVGHTAIINDVDLDPSGQCLASVSRDFTLKTYEVSSGKLLQTIGLGKRSLKSVCFWSAVRVVVGDYWGHAISVDLGSRKIESRSVARNGISAVKRSGEFVVAISYEGCALLLDPVSLAEMNRVTAMSQRLDAPWEGWGVVAAAKEGA